MPPSRSRLALIGAALLLAGYYALGLGASRRMGVTADEPIHLAGGASYWQADDYRLQPENGNFPQRWAALPLLALAPQPVARTDDTWRRTDLWGAAHRYLFLSGNPTDRMVFAGRAMIGLLGVAAGLLVFLLARGLFGTAGGLLATAAYVTSPSLLAHGFLATSDMAAGLGFLLVLATGWRLLHRITPGRVAGFGLALGLLALAKFSSVLIFAVWPVVVGLRLARNPALPVRAAGHSGWVRTRAGQAAAFAAAHGAAVLVAAACIWSAYGFRFSATSPSDPGSFNVSWEAVLGEIPFTLPSPMIEGASTAGSIRVRPDAVRAAVRWARDRRLLPEAYLYGFAHVYTYAQARPAFFAGEFRTTGWWNYFPVLYLVKTPLPQLLLVILTAAALLRFARRGLPAAAARRGYRLLPYVLFVAIYTGFSLRSPMNIGFRHLLPVEIVLALLTGLLAVEWPRQPAWRRGVLLGLAAAGGAIAWTAGPDRLAYFNPLAGGPRNGYRICVDSSVDWGQGLPALQDWLAVHPPAGPVFLAYFGSDSPAARGVPALRIGDEFFDRDPPRRLAALKPGLYVVSATLFHGVYTRCPEPWTAADEQRYRELNREYLLVDPAHRSPLFWREWDQVRFGRLCRYLRTRPPLAQPDPSLLLFALTEAELNTALAP